MINSDRNEIEESISIDEARMYNNANVNASQQFIISNKQSVLEGFAYE